MPAENASATLPLHSPSASSSSSYADSHNSSVKVRTTNHNNTTNRQDLVAHYAEDKPTGWYNCPRIYRSVAYGTWKVGSARKLLSSHQDLKDLKITDKSPLTSPHSRNLPSSASYGPDQPLLTQNLRKMFNSTDAFQAQAVWPRTGDPAGYSTSLSDNEGGTDYFSAEDYCRFKTLKQLRKRVEGNRHVSITSSEESLVIEDTRADLDQSLQNVMDSFKDLKNYVTMRPQKKRRFSKKNNVFHKRSQSAGSTQVFTVQVKAQETHRPKVAGAFNFLKNKFRKESKSSELLDSTHKHVTEPVQNGKRHDKPVISPISTPVISPVQEKRATLARIDSFSTHSSPCTPINGIDSPPLVLPQTFTPKHDIYVQKNGFKPLMNGSAGLKRDLNANTTQDPNFPSCDDALHHLRDELNTIRLRDYAILKRFQHLEQELRGIKVSDNGPSPIVELPPNLESAFDDCTPLPMHTSAAQRAVSPL